MSEVSHRTRPVSSRSRNRLLTTDTTDHVPLFVGLGEILWDLFPDGPRFGGAPANFACSAAALGTPRIRVAMASSVGQDPLGTQALATLTEKHVSVAGVRQSPQPTGQVLIDVDRSGAATYEFAADAAWDDFQWSAALEHLAQNTAVVCYGTLSQRSAISQQTVHQFLSLVPTDAFKIFDINLRPPHHTDRIIRESLHSANVLKMNEDELPVLAALCQQSGSTLEILQGLARQYDLQCVALTRGHEGAVLLRGEEISEHPGVTTKVIDTVGAGDAFTATLALGLLHNQPLADINRRACEVAAYVCSQAGATPTFPPEWTADTLGPH